MLNVMEVHISYEVGIFFTPRVFTNSNDEEGFFTPALSISVCVM